ncbi:Long-chain-fatty-acid--CoA ligase FadD15, partial [Haemophilus influenzae]
FSNELGRLIFFIEVQYFAIWKIPIKCGQL